MPPVIPESAKHLSGIQEENKPRWHGSWCSLDSGSRSPGSRPGSLGRNDKVDVIPEDRAAGYPGSRKGYNPQCSDGCGFWIPGLAPLARNDEKKKLLARNDEKKKPPARNGRRGLTPNKIGQHGTRNPPFPWFPCFPWPSFRGGFVDFVAEISFPRFPRVSVAMNLSLPPAARSPAAGGCRGAGRAAGRRSRCRPRRTFR